MNLRHVQEFLFKEFLSYRRFKIVILTIFVENNQKIDFRLIVYSFAFTTLQFLSNLDFEIIDTTIYDFANIQNDQISS